MASPLTCPNGHAMDEGLFECPCCGAYRPSANSPDALIRNGRVVGVKPPSDLMQDIKRAAYDAKVREMRGER